MISIFNKIKKLVFGRDDDRDDVVAFGLGHSVQAHPAFEHAPGILELAVNEPRLLSVAAGQTNHEQLKQFGDDLAPINLSHSEAPPMRSHPVLPESYDDDIGRMRAVSWIVFSAIAGALILGFLWLRFH